MAPIGTDLTAGFVGTLVLTTTVRAAAQLGFTRMDLSFLLGTIVTENRTRAKAWGYTFHFLIGVAFALGYGVFFRAVGFSSWWLGALLGIVHALFTSTVLVSVLLPVVHPRMATPETAADETALLEPPGFLMLNYGPRTFLVALAAHILYGAIVGWIIHIR
ncbi:MAG: hypothetical protein ACM3SQ_12175 [Betaproteobacteria bacterium]